MNPSRAQEDLYELEFTKIESTANENGVIQTIYQTICSANENTSWEIWVSVTDSHATTDTRINDVSVSRIHRVIGSEHEWALFCSEVVLPEIQRSPIGIPPLLQTILDAFEYDWGLDPPNINHRAWDMNQNTWINFAAGDADRLWCQIHVRPDDEGLWYLNVSMGIKLDIQGLNCSLKFDHIGLNRTNVDYDPIEVLE